MAWSELGKSLDDDKGDNMDDGMDDGMDDSVDGGVDDYMDSRKADVGNLRLCCNCPWQDSKYQSNIFS